MKSAHITVPHLTGPTIAAHVRTFTLTARPARFAIGPRTSVDAWTFNGTAPGPTLRVRQGDLVVVHLVNKLPVGTTIHWHGVVLPNAEDGVAGVTQDAVAPGHTYTYRFVVTQPGTYWYHAHQDGLTEVARGLFGALVIDPASPGPPASVDATVALHAWDTGRGDVLTVNATSGQLRIPAAPGAWVRLRLINTDNVLHQATVVGTPFTVIALDGHDLNGPQPLTATALPIGAAQRYDLLFRMPAHGAVGVRLASVSDDRQYDDAAAIVVGFGALPPAPFGVPAMFDMTTYGTPRPGSATLQTHADAYYTLRLGNSGGGFSRTHPDLRYTINDMAAPDTTPLMVKQGQLVRVHIVNDSLFIHPMHLHGHTFVVLARNGRPLRSSPVTLDTVQVFPHESYDIAFVANNPGIWMVHCHNLYHARHGMMTMIMYDNVTTPYKAGGPAGNISD